MANVIARAALHRPEGLIPAVLPQVADLMEAFEPHQWQFIEALYEDQRPITVVKCTFGLVAVDDETLPIIDPLVSKAAAFDTTYCQLAYFLEDRFKVLAGHGLGDRFVRAVSEALHINTAWLRSGEGQPYAVVVGTSPSAELPVSQVLLPGAPLAHQDLLTGGWVNLSGQLFAPSQYWLLLMSSQPIVREPLHGFRAGDQLLMETDRTRFPREMALCNDLCVVRLPAMSPPLKLGAVTHHEATEENGPARLEVDTFDLALDCSDLIREEVYRHLPGGEVHPESDSTPWSTENCGC
jgi:hypothetical protein